MAISDLFSTEADEADDGSARPTDFEFEFDEIQADPDDPLTVARNEELIASELEVAEKERSALVACAEQQILELSLLLSKTKATAATQDETDRMAALSKEVGGVKEELGSVTARVTEQGSAMEQAKVMRRNIEMLRESKLNEIQDVIRSVSVAESVDLAFVIDATGSMGPYIVHVKNTIQEIVRRIKNTNRDLHLRLAVVAYRDLDYPTEKHFEVLDFVQEEIDFLHFLSALEPIGGKDTAEDMAEGIRQANKLSWKNPTRVVFVVADNPCHGSQFHNLPPRSPPSDGYPNGSPNVDILKELRTLVSNHRADGSMAIYFGRLTQWTDQMIERFQECGIEIETVGFQDPGKIASAVTTAVRSSIFKTMSVGTTGKVGVAFASSLMRLPESTPPMEATAPATLKRYCIISGLPRIDEWRNRPSSRVKVFRSRPIKSMEDLKAPYEFGVIIIRRGKRTDGTKKSTMLLRCASEPFAEGQMRLSFHGQLAANEEEAGLPSSAVVLKTFKYAGEGVNDLKQYLKQMEVSNIAFYLSKVYNKSFRRAYLGRVLFLPVCVVEDLDEAKEDAGTRRFCAETPLPAEASSFTQYSNNTGYWNEEHLDETLLRFTEFTYQATNGYLMVADLQGVRKGSDFYLTDPVVLCEDVLRFGRTNLGGTFMHKCINATWAIMKEKGW